VAGASTVFLKVVKDGLDNVRAFAGDDLDRPAVMLTGLDVDVEDALRALAAAHGGVTLDGCFVRLLAIAFAASGRMICARQALLGANTR
jgi:hypothetical protein